MKESEQFPLRVSIESCIGCGACADACAYNAIRLTEAYPEIDPYNCRLCGSCVEACPSEALRIEQRTPRREAESAKGIWVLVEVEQGKITAVTKELLGKAVQLAEKRQQPVEALLIGYGVEALAMQLASFGADHVHVVDDARFSAFIEEEHAEAAIEVIRQMQPEILLVGATSNGRGVAARIAARLHTGLTADCTDLDIDAKSGLLHQIRPAFGGNLMATIVTPYHRPQMASVRPGVMKALEPRKTLKPIRITRHDDMLGKYEKRTFLLSEAQEDAPSFSLNNSRIVIGVGRGVKSKDTLKAIHLWAKSLGAAIGGSRAAVEAGLSMRKHKWGKQAKPSLPTFT